MTTAVLKVRNVEQALSDGFWWLRASGVHEQSRNGPVLVAPGPVITEYTNPTERVLFSPRRDANPVFHLVESLWMLAGLNDVRLLEPYNSNMRTYAEPDTDIIHGAYGHRWRELFFTDQITLVINQLIADRETRRAVVQMWSAADDLGKPKRDVPCNTQIYFDLRGGVLNMTVCCRSNDMLWGAYGANAVHFSMLQEVVAAAVGAPVGVYRQFSNNMHVYTENEMVQDFLDMPPAPAPAYYPGGVIPLIQPSESWTGFLLDCRMVFSEGVGVGEFETEFMRTIALPLMQAYLYRKARKQLPPTISRIPECDWKVAFLAWAARREA